MGSQCLNIEISTGSEVESNSMPMWCVITSNHIIEWIVKEHHKSTKSKENAMSEKQRCMQKDKPKFCTNCKQKNHNTTKCWEEGSRNLVNMPHWVKKGTNNTSEDKKKRGRTKVYATKEDMVLSQQPQPASHSNWMTLMMRRCQSLGMTSHCTECIQKIVKVHLNYWEETELLHPWKTILSASILGQWATSHPSKQTLWVWSPSHPGASGELMELQSLPLEWVLSRSDGKREENYDQRCSVCAACHSVSNIHWATWRWRIYWA